MNRRVVIAIVVAAILGVAVVGGLLVYVIRSGITGGIDAEFGDQHLKTTVALLELHRTRYGRYPDSLNDLKFIGEWDRIALSRVAYAPNPSRDAYYVEVTTGWVGKPTLSLPDEFWQGTGYRPALKPRR